MTDSKKIDPFDVEALEKSLNDSATRVSTIWVSFLVFSLYLLTAATTVTHRQLFLAEPVKLPVLNIDLPLWGFFWLAPILFVIFHAYVLIQLILLARTAAAYDAAVAKFAEQDNLCPEANASLRQRLANTLFAQILAGSPREREGWFGSLLKAMAWITLVIAPILILLTFQFMFLPYHSHLATWTHRMLILMGLVVAFKLWPLVLNPRSDFQRPNWRRRRRAWLGLRRLALPTTAALLFALLSLSLATFPGEWHVNLFTRQAINDIQCNRLIQRKFDFADMRFDRLALARVDAVDHDKLEKIQQATAKAGEQPYQGERTRVLRDRDLNCGDFSDYADLRRMDLSGAHLRNADFQNSNLEGISFTKSYLQGASLSGAQLQGASLSDAQLQDTFLNAAKLQGALLNAAKLQGASLHGAQLQGASLDNAQLQGADLFGTELQGASLDNAQLQGVMFFITQLQGASLNGAQLQGARSFGTMLQGASLENTQLQGALLQSAELDGAVLSRARIWLARVAECDKARITDPKFDAVIAVKKTTGKDEPIPATHDRIEEFIAQWSAGIRNQGRRDEVSNILRERLTTDPVKDESPALGEIWRRCEDKSRKISAQEFDRRHVAILRSAVCDARSDGAAIGKGIARNWISHDSQRLEFSSKLARALLGEDGKPCTATSAYDEETRRRLRAAAGAPSAVPVPK